MTIKPPGKDNSSPMGLAVYPSLHYLLSASRRKEEKIGSPLDLGDSALNGFIPSALRRPRVVAIKGPLGTLKSTFGTNFLIKGLMLKQDVLLIRLWDELNFDPKQCIISEETLKKKFDPDQLKSRKMGNVAGYPSHRVNAARYLYQPNGYTFTELAFKSGNVLPEEFMHIVLEYTKVNGREVKRVVLDDVSLIGTSYPLLRHSKIAGDLCLPAFVHLLRNKGIDLFLVGTIGDLAQANEAVHKTCALANFVLSCDFCEVFGERHITVQGQSTTASVSEPGWSSSELTPGVVKINGAGHRTFNIDKTLLSGLVGFGSSSISRPGLTFYAFQESGPLHDEYNDQVRKLLNFAYGRPFSDNELNDKPLSDSSRSRSDVKVIPFGFQDSSAFHEALVLPHSSPIDRTTLCTVDEFLSVGASGASQVMAPLPSNKANSSRQRQREQASPYLPVYRGIKDNIRPYYGNVLMLAYRWKGSENELSDFKDKYLVKGENRFKDWSCVLSAAEQIKNMYYGDVKYHFDCDWDVPETRSCALMDAIISSMPCEDIYRTGDDLQDRDQRRGSDALAYLTRMAGNTKLREPVMREVLALQQLLTTCAATNRKNRPDDLPREERYVSARQSAVCLCWYSQLRNLVNEFPDLAHEFHVCALPGRGFRGDWFIGIMKGSVSITLGKEVLDILCDKTEEYRRFVQGVGLPTLASFYGNEQEEKKPPMFYAWPGAKVPLEVVLDIHRDALSRACISGYRNFRTALYSMSEQIVDAGDDQERIWNTVSRLSTQAAFLSS